MTRGFRDFVQKPLGKVLLIAVTILVVFAVYVSVEAIIAIPAFLLFGLALPIWAGLKRPRYLALSGLVVILVVAPISSLVITQDIRTPISPADSLATIPGTGGTSLLQNASVSPYTGDTSTNFTWTVTLYRAGIPSGNNSTPLWLNLYISTCPGATSGTSPPSWCSAGYPFILLNYTFHQPLNATPLTVTFHHTIPSDGIWDWQMGVYTSNSTTHRAFYQNLVGDPTYNALEGPVVGGYWTTYGSILPTLYFDDFLFLGAPYYFILLLYLLFKNREQRRKDAAARAAGPVPSASGPGGTDTSVAPAPPPLSKSAGAPSAPLPSVKERTCPSCTAVVYENETTCWKCGATLTTPA